MKLPPHTTQADVEDFEHSIGFMLHGTDLYDDALRTYLEGVSSGRMRVISYRMERDPFGVGAELEAAR